VIRVKGDVLMSVPDSVQYMTPYVLREQEDWFEDEIKFLRGYLRPGMRVIDIGANYGLYTTAMARAVGAAGRVWAVEPCSNTAAHLRESLALNDFAQVTLIQAALSDQVGTARLRLERDPEQNALLGEGETADTVEEVSLNTLDRLVTKQGCAGIDFIKMDAEGAEERIVTGGMTFLNHESPLIMYEAFTDKMNDRLIDCFAGIGYASYRLVPGLDLLEPFQAGRDYPYLLNLFCCKADRAVALVAGGVLSEGNDPELPAMTPGAWWREELTQRPFARAFRSAWLTDAERAAGLGRAEYETALALYGVAHDPAHSATVRHAALKAAYKRVLAVCKQAPTPFRVSTAARIAQELGERRQALDLIGRAYQLATQPGYSSLEEPFLPASAAFEDIEPGKEFKPWLTAMLIDHYEALILMSSYQAGQGNLQNLEGLCATGFQRPEMERRRQLMRMRHGLQAKPSAAAVLAAARPDNLNPEYWAGKAL
jgi:FkbM family methyltransferase